MIHNVLCVMDFGLRHCQERIRSSVASVKSGCMKSVTSVAL